MSKIANGTKSEIRSSKMFEKSENMMNSVTSSVTNGHKESTYVTHKASTSSRESAKTNGWRDTGMGSLLLGVTCNKN